MTLSVKDLKQILVGADLEIYRVVDAEVILADRVRDNLIMDSGVSVVVAPKGLRVRLVLRAQASDFPDEAEADIFRRLVEFGQPTNQEGYAEASRTSVPVHDPGDKDRVLDTWHEVTYERPVAEDKLLGELKAALAKEKNVTP